MTTHTIVYRFGLLPPIEGADLARTIVMRGNRYQNDLTAIERGHRAALREVESQVGDVPALTVIAKAAAERTVNAYEAVKRARLVEYKTNGKKKRAVAEELTVELTAARAAETIAMHALRGARRTARRDPGVRANIDKIDGTKDAVFGQKNGLVGQLKRSARKGSGLHWGSYSRIEAAVDASRRAIDKLGGLYDGTEPNDPSFSRYDGSGLIGAAQLVGGISLGELFPGEDPRVRMHIGTGPLPGHDTTPKRDKSATLAINVARATLTCPEWIVWPVVQHRPFPADALIREVKVLRRMRGPREEWSVSFTLETSERTSRPTGTGSVAVDIGWRLIDGEMRVAAWRGEDARPDDEPVIVRLTEAGIADLRTMKRVPVGELRLDARLLAYLKRASSIDGARDANLEAVRGARAMSATRETPFRPAHGLVAWLDTNASIVPDWLRERTKTLEFWRSPDALRKLVLGAPPRWPGEKPLLGWVDRRFPGDEAIMGQRAPAFERAPATTLTGRAKREHERAWRLRWRNDHPGSGLLAWAYQDIHLAEYETSVRTSALRCRRHLYRNVAAILSMYYGMLVLEDFDLRVVSKKPKASDDDENDQNEVARANRVIAAVSELRLSLVHAFARHVKLPEIKGKGSTHVHADCGSIEVFDAAKSIWHVCSKCGVRFDQDYNAAAVLLGRHRERSNDALITATAREDEKPSQDAPIRENRFQRTARKAADRRAAEVAAREAVPDPS